MAKVKQPTYEDAALPPEAPAVRKLRRLLQNLLRPWRKPAAKKGQTGRGRSCQQPDTLALGVLRAFPNYPTLYWTVKAEPFRPTSTPGYPGRRRLYRNPFHKS